MISDANNSRYPQNGHEARYTRSSGLDIDPRSPGDRSMHHSHGTPAGLFVLPFGAISRLGEDEGDDIEEKTYQGYVSWIRQVALSRWERPPLG